MRQMISSRLGATEHKRNSWRCNLETGTTVEELLDPQFFVNITCLRAGDMIEAVRDDASGMALLLVREATRTGVKVGLVHIVDFTAQDELREAAVAAGADSANFRAEFNLEDKWRVVRVSDGVVVDKGLASEAAARKAIANHLKTLG
jgi:hypothetical protein